MKKIGYLLLIVPFVIGCKDKENTTSSLPVGFTDFVDNYEYAYGDDEKYQTFWDTNVIYNEPVTLVENEDGTISSNLLYTPSRIIRVQNYTLEAEYDPTCYEIRGNTFILKNKSKMPYLTRDNVTLKELPIGVDTLGAGDRAILFTETTQLLQYQTMVSYTTGEPFIGSKPVKKGEELPLLQKKIKNKQFLNMVVYGDSVYVGASSSAFHNIPPYVDTLPNGFKNQLIRKYGMEVEMTNMSEGGRGIVWALDNVETRVNTYNPDLVIVAFGVNDSLSQAVYKAKMENLVKKIKDHDSDTEIILISPEVPTGPSYVHQIQYLPVLEEIASDNSGVSCLDFTTYSGDLLERKSSFELYSNNTNHPDDFLVRGFTSLFLNHLELN